MIYELFRIPVEQRKELCSAEIIENDDLKRVFQGFSSGKIKRVRVGKLAIAADFIPKLKRSALKKHEGHYVFFALEKCKTSFFAKAHYRIFIWPLYAERVFAVPVEMVSFESPGYYSKEAVLLKRRIVEQPVVEGNFYGKDHSCICEQICASREFWARRKYVICSKDLITFHFRWTDPDYWVDERFTATDGKEAMFFAKNAPKEFLEQTDMKAPFRYRRCQYPIRPPRVRAISPFGVELHNSRL